MTIEGRKEVQLLWTHQENEPKYIRKDTKLSRGW